MNTYVYGLEVLYSPQGGWGYWCGGGDGGREGRFGHFHVKIAKIQIKLDSKSQGRNFILSRTNDLFQLKIRMIEENTSFTVVLIFRG